MDDVKDAEQLGEKLLPGESRNERPRKPPIPQWQERTLVVGGLATVVLLPLTLLVWEPRHSLTGSLPFHAALGSMLIIGWLFGRGTDFFFGLPPLLGYIAFGFVFRDIEGFAMTAARPYILKLAFILVLIRAGLEIHPSDLKPFTVALGTVPFAADVLASAATASSIFGLSPLEALAFSAIMCALGDGIVIPRMIDLCTRARGSSAALARAVLTAAPIECTSALFFYGTVAELLAARPPSLLPALLPLAAPPAPPPTLSTHALNASASSAFGAAAGANGSVATAAAAAAASAAYAAASAAAAAGAAAAAASAAAESAAEFESSRPPWPAQIALVLARLFGTLLVAAALAHVFALLLGARSRIMWRSGKRLFAGTQHEELVVVLAAALLAYGTSAMVPMPARFRPTVRAPSAGVGPAWPLGAAPAAGLPPPGAPPPPAQGEALVEADLAVVATLFFFARLRPAHTVLRVEESIGAVWTVASLFLFASLGSNLSFALEPATGPLALLLPLLAGLAARAAASFCVLVAFARARGLPPSLGLAATLRNGATEACFYLAATLPRATLQGVLGGLPLQAGIVSAPVGELMHSAAAVTVLLLAPLGVVAQELLCERLLAAAVPPAAAPARPPAPAAARPWLHSHAGSQTSALGGQPATQLAGGTAGSRTRVARAASALLAPLAGWLNAARWLSGRDGQAEAQPAGEAPLLSGEGAQGGSAPLSAGRLPLTLDDARVAPIAEEEVFVAAAGGAELPGSGAVHAVELAPEESDLPPSLERRASLSIMYGDGPTLPAAGASISAFSAERAGRQPPRLPRAQTSPHILP